MPANRKPIGTEAVLMFLLGNPLRKRLLRLYVEAKEMRSPKQLTVPVNKDVSIVSYHVRVLAEHGAVELGRDPAATRRHRALLQGDQAR